MTLGALIAIIISVAILLIGVPLLFGLVGVIHAVRDSIRQRRMPPVILIVLAAVSVVLFAFYLYSSVRFYGSGRTILAMIGTLIWSRLELILLASGTVCALAGFGTYVFLSFHEDNVSESTHARKTDSQDKDSPETAAHKTVLINRALTIVICGILLFSVVVLILLKSAALVDHDISVYKSPDGQHTLIVDNETEIVNNTERYYSHVFLRMSPFFVRVLEESEGRSVHMEFDPDEIQWYDDTVLIPYGNTYLTYYIGGYD